MDERPFDEGQRMRSWMLPGTRLLTDEDLIVWNAKERRHEVLDEKPQNRRVDGVRLLRSVLLKVREAEAEFQKASLRSLDASDYARERSALFLARLDLIETVNVVLTGDLVIARYPLVAPEEAPSAETPSH